MDFALTGVAPACLLGPMKDRRWMHTWMLTHRWSRRASLAALLFLGWIATGCYGNQQIAWNDTNKISSNSVATVKVDAQVPVPPEEVDFIQTSVQAAVNALLTGKDRKYAVDIHITRYEEGSAFARCMLIGLGQMYLDATITISEGNPPKVAKTGTLKKNYMVGGLVGMSATMRADITSKLAGDVTRALKESLE